MTDGVFIAMPVYQGSEVVEETLRSILAQTFQDFHLVMSVDGADDPTVEICRKYEDDPRIDVVVQETRLGWPGNFNWLVEACDREFFCYWQQDDLASTRYLESLRRELLARPDAAIAYTDVQWFGARFDRNGSPSIEGEPLHRVMQHIEAIRYEPLRGLMRASMLPSTGEAIPMTEDESCQEEFVFLTDMAAAGPFLRVDSAMYFKRLHTDNAFVRWARFPEWRRRRAWVSMGAGMYQIARRLAEPDLRSRVLGQILDRLAIERHGRAHFYAPAQTPDEVHRFVRDFVAYADVPEGDLISTRQEPLERPIHPEVLRALQLEEGSAKQRARFASQLQSTGELAIDLEEPTAGSILGFGWSHRETWGVWSDGEEVTLRIPAPDGSLWRATAQCRVYAPTGPALIGFSDGGRPIEYVEAGATDGLRATVQSDSRLLRLQVPGVRAPVDYGLSDDTRALGIGLTRFDLHLVDHAGAHRQHSD